MSNEMDNIGRVQMRLDKNWRFQLGEPPQANCTADQFPINLNDSQCFSLNLQAFAISEDVCRAVCCGDPACEVWQWCPSGAPCSPQATCWTGTRDKCAAGKGWISSARTTLPSPTPLPPTCQEPECSKTFPDKSWRQLDIPHDFVVEGVFTPLADVNHGYLPYGYGWYRLHFTIPSSWKGKSIWIDFDGIQRDSRIYLNNVLLGRWASGYTSFRYFLEDSVISFTTENVLAIRVDATAPDSWWYDGGGVYRHVTLNAANPVHIQPWGVYVPSKIDMDTIESVNNDKMIANAAVNPYVTVENKFASGTYQFSVQTDVLDGDAVVATGTVRGQSVQSGANVTVAVPGLVVSAAKLWSVTSPFLYRLRTSVIANGTIVDSVDTTFGIRSVQFDNNLGFLLNGQRMKIQGMANHQDFCGVGVAVPDSLQTYRVALMKKMGANAWRTAHNPPNPELLDECDRQGMLVWDENHRNLIGDEWTRDLESLILRDRNHPSVIIWSLCNEVLCEGFNATTAYLLHKIVNRLDPFGNRSVSAAMNDGYSSDFRNALDMIGINYHVPDYDALHSAKPSQPVIGSETSSDVSDRSIYSNNNTLAYVSAYDVNYPSWGNSAEDSWCPILSRDFMSGGFVWTGFDYKGEPTPYQWPNINSHFGVIDICGYPKDNFYYYQSVWLSRDQPIIHILPHWNWDAIRCDHCRLDEQGTPLIDVWVYSNADTVELFLNNQTLGKQSMPIPACRHINWTVPYQPGTLTAKGYRNGINQVFASETIETNGAPSQLELELEFPNDPVLSSGKLDVALVTLKVLDAQGRLIPTASPQDPISFTLSGTAATIIGLGNGDPSSHESDKPKSPVEGSRSAWNGLARVVVQAESDETGQVTLHATHPTLGTTSLILEVV
eukprot:c10119_g1_i6.p1 GENE.c10119_g1_i6~~c10119_g1_i6.p1  ORF type:complete len:890 (+),score=230.90 c10119_g1_i6:273-2942(+)